MSIDWEKALGEALTPPDKIDVMPDNIDSTYTYNIEQGTLVFVCKPTGVGTRYPIFFDFIEHVMKKNMMFAKLTGADVLTVPPGALGIHRLMSCIPISKRDLLKQMICCKVAGGGSKCRSFWELLEDGYNIFATGNKKYPYLAVHWSSVIDDNETKYQQIFGKPSPSLGSSI